MTVNYWLTSLGVEYGYVLREGRDAIILEKNEDMKKRGLAKFLLEPVVLR